MIDTLIIGHINHFFGIRSIHIRIIGIIASPCMNRRYDGNRNWLKWNQSDRAFFI